MAFTNTLRTDTPASGGDPREVDDRIRESKAAVVERLDTDHYIPASASNTYDDADTGEHKKVTLRKQAASPTYEALKMFVIAKEVDGITELFTLDSSNNEKQITKGGQLNIVAGDIPADTVDEILIELSNNAYLEAANAAGTGTVDLIKANSSDKPVIPDEAQLATDAAPTTDAMIANKKYIDDQITAINSIFGAKVTTDSNSNALVHSETYKATSDGFVFVDYVRVGGAQYANIKTDTSNPPIARVAYAKDDSSFGHCHMPMFAFVRKNEYWKLTRSGSPTVGTIYFQPIGIGECQKQ